MSIRKLVVANGISYVEIPAAGLYLLCGSPADSVKHLLRRGIIQTTEQNGIAFENGPNAILLSDTMVQNGHLCNLAEFPILQMLYRQGMLIPNHPNNTGRKPKLIGTPEQLAAQLRYIHRGNYGLISAEEMIKAGVDEREAEELMRIKLKFAFGQISRPDAFVDCLPLTRERWTSVPASASSAWRTTCSRSAMAKTASRSTSTCACTKPIPVRIR